jgi:hypothetical protein
VQALISYLKTSKDLAKGHESRKEFSSSMSAVVTDSYGIELSQKLIEESSNTEFHFLRLT